jgi:hypothetical protein
MSNQFFLLQFYSFQAKNNRSQLIKTRTNSLRFANSDRLLKLMIINIQGPFNFVLTIGLVKTIIFPW